MGTSRNCANQHWLMQWSKLTLKCEKIPTKQGGDFEMTQRLKETPKWTISFGPFLNLRNVEHRCFWAIPKCWIKPKKAWCLRKPTTNTTRSIPQFFHLNLSSLAGHHPAPAGRRFLGRFRWGKKRFMIRLFRDRGETSRVSFFSQFFMPWDVDGYHGYLLMICLWFWYGCFQIIHFDRLFHYKPSILGYP